MNKDASIGKTSLMSYIIIDALYNIPFSRKRTDRPTGFVDEIRKWPRCALWICPLELARQILAHLSHPDSLLRTWGSRFARSFYNWRKRVYVRIPWFFLLYFFHNFFFSHYLLSYLSFFTSFFLPPLSFHLYFLPKRLLNGRIITRRSHC